MSHIRCSFSSRESGRPSNGIAIIGILLDTQQMEAQLPQEKFLHLQSTIVEWVSRKNAKKRDPVIGGPTTTCLQGGQI